MGSEIVTPFSVTDAIWNCARTPSNQLSLSVLHPQISQPRTHLVQTPRITVKQHLHGTFENLASSSFVERLVTFGS